MRPTLHNLPAADPAPKSVRESIEGCRVRFSDTPPQPLLLFGKHDESNAPTPEYVAPLPRFDRRADSQEGKPSGFLHLNIHTFGRLDVHDEKQEERRNRPISTK